MAPTDPRIGCLRVHRMTLEPLTSSCAKQKRYQTRGAAALLASCHVPLRACPRATRRSQRGPWSSQALRRLRPTNHRVSVSHLRVHRSTRPRGTLQERERGRHTHAARLHPAERERTSCQERFDQAAVPLERGDVQSAHGRLRAYEPFGPVRCCYSLGRTDVSHPARSAVSGASVSTAARQSRQPWH
jgi:hypothetical protein